MSFIEELRDLSQQIRQQQQLALAAERSRKAKSQPENDQEKHSLQLFWDRLKIDNLLTTLKSEIYLEDTFFIHNNTASLRKDHHYGKDPKRNGIEKSISHMEEEIAGGRDQSTQLVRKNVFSVTLDREQISLHWEFANSYIPITEIQTPEQFQKQVLLLFQEAMKSDFSGNLAQRVNRGNPSLTSF